MEHDTKRQRFEDELTRLKRERDERVKQRANEILRVAPESRSSYMGWNGLSSRQNNARKEAETDLTQLTFAPVPSFKGSLDEALIRKAIVFRDVHETI